MSIAVRPVTLGDIAGVRDCVGVVAQERRFLAVTQPFTLQETALFIAGIIDHGHLQYVADDAGRIVGWCDIIPQRGESIAHVGVLGMGVLHGWRGRGLGSRLMQLDARRGAANAASRSSSRRLRPQYRSASAVPQVRFRRAGPQARRAQGGRASTTT